MAKKKEEETTFDDLDGTGSEITKPDLDGLLAPFHASQIDYKPTSTSGNRALALAYIDARDVATRLDLVVGAMNWNDEYEVVNTENNIVVLCRLTVNGVTKGGIGEGAKSDTEPFKSAESDAFKRAAVKFGVARGLYYLPKDAWVPYDSAKKKLLSRPFTSEHLMVAAALAGWQGAATPEREPEGENQASTAIVDEGYTNTPDVSYTDRDEQPTPPQQGQVCSICKQPIPNAVSVYSMRTFGKNLCRPCQGKVARVA